MADIIKLVQGDTLPQLKLELTDNLTQAPIDLTGCSVTLHVRPENSSVLSFSRPAIVLTAQDALDGIAYIQWVPGDLDRAPGPYVAEVEIVTPTGDRETIYDMLQLLIREDIG